MKVKINHLQETPAELFTPDGKLVGSIHTVIDFLDVRIQIAQQHLSGYYLIFNNERINIDCYGEMESYPNGLFDAITIQLAKIIKYGNKNSH